MPTDPDTLPSTLDGLKRLMSPDNPDALYCFGRGAMGRDYLRPEPHRDVCRYVQECFLNRQWADLVMPRMFLKSTIVSEMLPIWGGGWFPNRTFLLVRNIVDNATAGLSVICAYWERNTLVRALFPAAVPPPGKKNRWSDHLACLNRAVYLPQVTYTAAGVRTALASGHWTDIIADDLICARENPETQELYEPTREDIETACGWLNRMPPLHQDPATGWFFNTTTRWCDDDTIAYTAKWPMRHMLVDSIDETGPEPRPVYERFGFPVLDRLRIVMGEFLFSALMRNKPLSSATRVFQRDDIVYMPQEFTEPPEAPAGVTGTGMRFVAAVDPAGTKTRESDYFAAVVVGIDDSASWYVVQYINERIGNSISDQGDRLVDLIKNWHIGDIVVEDNFWHGALCTYLRERLEAKGLWCTVHPRTGSGALKKDTRIQWLQPMFKAHKVLIKRDMPELESQLLGWRPGAKTLKHDDIIDALGWVRQAAHTPAAPVLAREPVAFNSWAYVQQEVAAIRARNGSLDSTRAEDGSDGSLGAEGGALGFAGGSSRAELVAVTGIDEATIKPLRNPDTI